MSEWIAIDKAPRDRRVILWSPTLYGGRTYIGEWDDDRYSKRPRPCWRGDTYRDINTHRANPPTHYMPLPEPPAEVKP